MYKLIAILKEIAVEFDIKNYQWDIPDTCPIQIPDLNGSNFEKNIYLKENFADFLIQNNDLKHYYWIIQEWSGIGSFKRNDVNDEKLKKFLIELSKNKLTKNSFDRISSFSKVVSFLEPDNYAIYDSRVIYSLNWLIFNYAPEIELFYQPSGRSAELAKFDMQTIFRLSGQKYAYRSHQNAFHDYCDLMKKLSVEVYGEGSKPYLLEMLLFTIAPTKIVSDIEFKVSVKINN